MNYCGTNCDECQFQSPCACRGCGTPFYGTCPVEQCAAGKNLPHCGACDAFPCEKLTDCAHDPYTGDSGRRIERLKNL